MDKETDLLSKETVQYCNLWEGTAGGPEQLMSSILHSAIRPAAFHLLTIDFLQLREYCLCHNPPLPGYAAGVLVLRILRPLMITNLRDGSGTYIVGGLLCCGRRGRQASQSLSMSKDLGGLRCAILSKADREIFGTVTGWTEIRVFGVSLRITRFDHTIFAHMEFQSQRTHFAQ